MKVRGGGDSPFFCVVVPLYNKEKYVAGALDSVLAQTYGNYEVVVVDDGSTDSSRAVVEPYARAGGSKVRLISQENGGETSARNAAMRSCACDYYAFLDADDTWAEDHLESLAEVARACPGADILTTAYTVLLGSRTAYSNERDADEVGCRESYWLTLDGGYDFVWSSAAAVSRRAVERDGYFLEGVKIGGDLEYWSRIAESNPLVGFSAHRSAFYNRAADGNARTSVKVAHAAPFMDRLERLARGGSLSDAERAAITRKFAKKEVVYIFTTILSGDRGEGRRLVREWSLGANPVLKALLYASSLMPQCVNDLAFRIRLRVQ